MNGSASVEMPAATRLVGDEVEDAAGDTAVDGLRHVHNGAARH